MASLDEELKQTITCIICKELIIDNIYQCRTGHLYCWTCITKIKQCALCNIPIEPGSIRALAVEQLRDHVSLPCKNPGCEISTSQHNKHKKECRFNKCITTSCDFTGDEEQLQEHNLICKYTRRSCLYDGGCRGLYLKDEYIKHMETEHKIAHSGIDLGIRIKLASSKELKNTYSLRTPNNDIITIVVCKSLTTVSINITTFITEFYYMILYAYGKKHDNMTLELNAPCPDKYIQFNVLNDVNFDIVIMADNDRVMR